MDKNFIFEVTQAIGNVSTWYKTCVQSTEGSATDFYQFMLRY